MIDASLKYLKLAADFFNFSQFAMSNARNLRSRDDCNLSNEQCIGQFISDVSEPLLADLIAEIVDTMKETSPVLSGFDLFNPESLDKSEQDRKELL